jgi:CRP-like cAMP-binding protein
VNIPAEIYSFVLNEERFPDQAVIFREDGHGKWCYLILEGKVKIKKNTPKGQATLFTLGQGEIIGEVELLRQGAIGRKTSAVADDSVLLGLLDTDAIIESFKLLSPQMRKILSVLAKRFEDGADKVSENLTP